MAARAATTITIASAAIPPAPYGPEGLKNEVSTRNETVVVAEFPARSKTVSVTVWGPSAKLVMTWEVSEAPRLWAGPPSTLISTRSTPEVASPVENTVVTWEELITLPEAGETIATSGSVVSTVTVAVAAAELPTWSTPVTVIVSRRRPRQDDRRSAVEADLNFRKSRTGVRGKPRDRDGGRPDQGTGRGPRDLKRGRGRVDAHGHGSGL